jgi:hypothetical protein
MLGLSLHDWETVMLAALAVAGIAAVVVGVSTYCVVQLQRQESAASKKELAQLSTEAEQLKGETARAHERTAELEKDAAALRAQSEADRLARLKLEAQIAPRHITQAQQNELTARLSQYKDVVGTIVASPSTPESEMFVSWLTAPLHAAGWKITMLRTSGPMVLFPRGVIIRYPWELGKSVTVKPDGRLTVPDGPWGPLADTLNEFGIEATALPEPMEASQNIAIIVSEK